MGINNEAIAILMALVILYISGQVSERIFGKEAVGGFKGWLWSGIVPFLFIWIVLWILLIQHQPCTANYWDINFPIFSINLFK